jgi:short subunit dehydrogenase-like uncharacterized protein
VQGLLKRRVLASVRGPDAARRADSWCHVWGEVRNAAGDVRRAQLHTPNGYDVTVWASLGIAERLLAERATPGFSTPSHLMGADYILRMPGVHRITQTQEEPEPA